MSVCIRDPRELYRISRAILRLKSLMDVIRVHGNGEDMIDSLVMAEIGSEIAEEAYEALGAFADEHRESWSKAEKGGAR